MHSPRRKVADREEALELLAAWEGSGETFGAFCEDYGVDGRSLHCWKRNLDRRHAAKEPIRLIELTPVSASSGAIYRITVGSVTVEVGDDFHDDTLARLLAVVGC